MSGQHLKGGPELLAFLDAFPAKLQKGALRAGAVAAAKPVRDQARANVRKKSGKTAKAIKTGSSRINQDGTVSVRVQLKGEHAYVGWFLEYGVAAHLVNVSEADRPKYTTRDGRTKSRSIRFVDKAVKSGSLVIGENFIGPVVMHPGFAAMPFLRPALDTRANDAINAFGARVRSYLSSKSGFTAPLVETVEE